MNNYCNCLMALFGNLKCSSKSKHCIMYDLVTDCSISSNTDEYQKCPIKFKLIFFTKLSPD